MSKDGRALRLVVELHRAQDPRLYDELMRFRHSARRANRLCRLAYDGLLVQDGLFAFGKQSPPGQHDAEEVHDIGLNELPNGRTLEAMVKDA